MCALLLSTDTPVSLTIIPQIYTLSLRFLNSRYFKTLLKDKAAGDETLVKELYYEEPGVRPKAIYPERKANNKTTSRRTSIFGGKSSRNEADFR